MRTKSFKLWLPVVFWAGLIFTLSAIPDLKSELEYDFFLRKVAHVVEYLIFTFLLLRAFEGSFKMGAWELFIYPAIIALLYAASDEFHQHFVRGRRGCVEDILVDAIGILGLYVLMRRTGVPHGHM